MTYGAVAEGDSTSELDEITGTDGIVLLHEWDEVVDRVVDAVVGSEVGFDGREKKHRPVGTATAAIRSSSVRRDERVNSRLAPWGPASERWRWHRGTSDG